MIRVLTGCLLSAAAMLCVLTTPLAAQTGGDDPFAELGEPQGAAGADPASQPASLRGVRVTLRGIDKLTGEVVTVETVSPGEARMWRLDIKVAACFRRPAQRAPESSVFLQVFDTKSDPAEQLFSGWMFASSPALSAMDHARYDVWVISCNTS